MKLNPKQSLMQPLISEIIDYFTPAEIPDEKPVGTLTLLTAIPPNPPTPEAVAKAQFVDKTYQWKGSAANKAADVQPNI